MKIGIIGTGTVAQALINGFISEGYEVKVGTRNPESENIVKLRQDHRDIKIGTYVETVEYGDIIIAPVPGATLEKTIKEIGTEKFDGKIFWDITNAFADEAPSNGVIRLITTSGESLAESIQKILPNTQVVKALNTVGAHLMYKPTLSENGTVFIAGNSEDAKNDIAGILSKFGWETYNAGKIESSRAIEYMGQFYVAQGIQFNNWNMTFKYVK